MRLLKNRIIVSLILIAIAVFVWEFGIKPVTGPLYTEAVTEYKRGNYVRSLELLERAADIDPNDAAILALIGWNHLKMGNPRVAEEPYFRRAHEQAPHVVDISLGYAYAEIALGKFDQARMLLDRLRQVGVDNPDMHVAQGALYREQGRYREAAEQFQLALARDPANELAAKNLRELLNVSGDVSDVKVEFAPLVRPAELQVFFRASGSYLEWRSGTSWRPTYLAGVNVSAALPGSYPAESLADPAMYADWLNRIGEMGANSVRVNTLMPPAFYRALGDFNAARSQRPIFLVQGISFGDPPRDDMFNGTYYQQCQKDIRDTIDVVHGRGDVAMERGHAGGVYTTDLSPWVAGFVIGQKWLSHVVTANNLLHPDIQKYEGTYIEVPAGTPTEIFLAQMVNYTAEYEEGKYNWQHPVAFLNWPTLDPVRHPTESTILEEVAIRRAQGERVPTPAAPYDDDDGVSVDPTKLRPRAKLAAGYFAAYDVLPFYPDFLNQDPRYQAVRDAEGNNPFLGYLLDLKASHAGMPVVITEYGVPTSMGVGHFSPAGFDEGGKTETQQGQLLARLSRSVRESGAAGGMIFEWVDQWFRQSWSQRNYEVPANRRVLWTNAMNPAENFGVMAADPRGRSIHTLSGQPSEWIGQNPFYAESHAGLATPLGDRYDPGRDLKALYVDADEGFLYLRLVVSRLDNDNDGQPDWKDANYLIGLATAPNVGGITYLPFITPIRFPMGITYAIQLAGPAASRIWIASSYNPFRIVTVEGIPTQTTLGSKLGWKPSVASSGNFEAQIAEPNRRRYSRDGRYFPPQRYERGILRFGSLDPQAADYDALAQWHTNVQTNTVDLRIPWNLLNVTDPSSFKVFAGLEADGTVVTTDTSGFLVAAFSYRPLESARSRPIMDQGHPVADALPGMAGPATLISDALKQYRWTGWNAPRYNLRLKDSYAILRKALPPLTAPPGTTERPAERAGRGGRAGAGQLGSSRVSSGK
jgi:tetratricopeptide (TPR) repeat protein